MLTKGQEEAARHILQNIGVGFLDKQGRYHKVKIDIKKDGGKLSVYQECETGFVKGDKVVFLKNDKKLHVQNGLTGEIVSLNKDGAIKIRTESGRYSVFNINADYQYLSWLLSF